MFVPSQLTLARASRGLTKEELAHRISLTPRSIRDWESGKTLPSTESLNRLAEVLEFNTFFFFRPLPLPPATDQASFRSARSTTAGLRKAALAQSSFAYAIADWVDERFTLPAAMVPDVASCAPEEAAILVRAEWGLSDRPISNMVHLLESKGVKTFQLTVYSRQVDAFSVWRNGSPYVFLNGQKSAERSRFDAAHELGHLVMHRNKASNTNHSDQEKEADAFASAFLMPRSAIYASGIRTFGVRSLLAAKRQWKVSLSALNYRLHNLGLSSDWIYRNNCIEIAKNGWRTQEPEGIARERSQVFERILKMLWAKRITVNNIAEDLDLPVDVVRELMFGLDTTSSEGANQEFRGLTVVRPAATN